MTYFSRIQLDEDHPRARDALHRDMLTQIDTRQLCRRRHRRLEACWLHAAPLGYRKGKDSELKQMAKYLASKAKETGAEQQLGPLNPYERRLVHMAVSEVPGVGTESVGDSFAKTVTISLKRG